MTALPEQEEQQPSIDFDFIGRVVHPEIEDVSDPRLPLGHRFAGMRPMIDEVL